MDSVWELWENPRPGRSHGSPRFAVPLTKRPVPILRLQHGSGTILVEDRCRVSNVLQRTSNATDGATMDLNLDHLFF